MRPAELLDCQRDLRRKFDDPEFQAVVSGSLAQAAGYSPREVSSAKVRREAGWISEMVHRIAPNATEAAQVFEVVRPMVSLTEWAAATLEDITPFDRTLPFVEWGLVRFDGGIRLADRRGEDLGMDWVLWFPVHGTGGEHGVGILGFNDALANPDSVTRSLRGHADLAHIWASIGRWAYTFFTVVYQDQRIGPALIDSAAVWSEMGGAEGNIVPSTNVTRLMVALWTLMREPVVSLREERPDRAAAKRMRRMKMPETVTVITLRHLVEAGDPRGEVEWQHHWIVRGHYRWQAYGAGRLQRRLIYIAPHVKGNTDAPLLQTKKVHRLVR